MLHRSHSSHEERNSQNPDRDEKSDNPANDNTESVSKEEETNTIPAIIPIKCSYRKRKNLFDHKARNMFNRPWS
ncbi:hypothetical protein ACOME3_004197 [Neoechinorhynchus agilis]